MQAWGCCAQTTEAHFETIRYKLDKLDNQVHRLDDRYKTEAEHMLTMLDDKEQMAKARLESIANERYELEQKVKHWKIQRDAAETDMLAQTRTRSCGIPNQGCHIM